MGRPRSELLESCTSADLVWFTQADELGLIHDPIYESARLLALMMNAHAGKGVATVNDFLPACYFASGEDESEAAIAERLRVKSLALKAHFAAIRKQSGESV